MVQMVNWDMALRRPMNQKRQIDIGSGDRPRPTYVSAKLDLEYKQELIDLLKEFKDYFAW